MFYALFVCGHYLIQYRFIQVCIFYLFPYITVFFDFSLKQLVRTDTRHKNLITALNKKHASRELLSFKNSIYKKNLEHLQNETL